MVRSLLTFSGKLGHSLNSFFFIYLLSEVEGGGGRGEGGEGLKNPPLGLNRDNNNNGKTTMLFYSTKKIS